MGSFAGQKVVCPLAHPASPSLDRIKICCADKNGPPPGGCLAENAHSMRTDFWGNNHFTYGFFAVLFSEAFAVQRRHYLRKTGMARRLNPASQVKVRVSQLSHYQSW
jgi:hypothetical protein